MLLNVAWAACARIPQHWRYMLHTRRGRPTINVMLTRRGRREDKNEVGRGREYVHVRVPKRPMTGLRLFCDALFGRTKQIPRIVENAGRVSVTDSYALHEVGEKILS